MMVFVPVALASALGLRDGRAPHTWAGFAGTPTLRQALSAGDDEEAEFAALNIAGVAALDGLGDGRRLVLAAAVDDRQVTDHGSGLGEVDVRDLGWPQVQALFADEELAGPAVARAAASASGVSVTAAVDLPAVVELTDGFDLLWYAPAELDALR